MDLLSIKVSTCRDQSPSRSPLSPTVIHYHQKYQIEKNLQNSHQEIKRHYHHHHQRQQIRHRSHQYHQNRRINKISPQRQLSNLWEIHKSSNGRIYYYNVVTDKSQWEKPSTEQLSLSSSSIRKKSIHSKRISNNNKQLFTNKSHHFKKSNRTTRNSIHSHSSHHHHHHHHHYKRKKHNIDIKSSFKNSPEDKTNIGKVVLSTPISPPENEKIQIDFVDPIPTPTNSNSNNSIPFISSQQSHCQISSISLPIHSKQSIKNQIIEDLSSTINQSSLCLSQSTINAILELEHSSTILSTNTNLNFDHITRYYRAELIEHLLNWPSTQIEREAIRLSNEQIRFTTCQLTSLRTDLFTIRLKFERNRFQLLKYHYHLIHQENLLNKLQFIDSD